jgi:putative FmdB family regulatory protein
MPTYEYKCTSGHLFEEFQSINTEPVAICPQCGSPASRVIGSGAALVFKGSGFYITDYKKSDGSAGNNGKAALDKSKRSKDIE